MVLVIAPLLNIPLIKPGNDITKIILNSLDDSNVQLFDGDIIVLAQKIVSKAEGRLVNLTTITPSLEANKLSKITKKDPRLVELILQESNQILRTRTGLIIVEHRLGFVCANAGIDHSNVKGEWGRHEDWFLLLPKNPDLSANSIREEIVEKTGNQIGVMIIDSHGRAWRKGTVGVCIGLSGVPGLIDFRGRKDLFDFELRVTEVGAADELAAAASILMGQAGEGIPAVHVSGYPYQFRETCLEEILRPKEKDLFR